MYPFVIRPKHKKKKFINDFLPIYYDYKSVEYYDISISNYIKHVILIKVFYCYKYIVIFDLIMVHVILNHN